MSSWIHSDFILLPLVHDYLLQTTQIYQMFSKFQGTEYEKKRKVEEEWLRII